VVLWRLCRVADHQAVAREMTWQDAALCLGMCAETNFFPDLREGEDPRPAMEVCNHCPVRVECLDYAVADPHTSGIWGGVLFTSRKGRVRR